MLSLQGNRKLEGRKAFLEACQISDLDKIEELIQDGIDPLFQNQYPLFHAIAHNQIEVVKRFLRIHNVVNSDIGKAVYNFSYQPMTIAIALSRNQIAKLLDRHQFIKSLSVELKRSIRKNQKSGMKETYDECIVNFKADYKSNNLDYAKLKLASLKMAAEKGHNSVIEALFLEPIIILELNRRVVTLEGCADAVHRYVSTIVIKIALEFCFIDTAKLILRLIKTHNISLDLKVIFIEGIRRGLLDVVEFMLAEYNIEPKWANEAIDRACQFGQLDIYIYLRDLWAGKVIISENAHFINASANGHTELVQYMLNSTTLNPRQSNSDEANPYITQEAINFAINWNQSKVVEVLLSDGRFNDYEITWDRIIELAGYQIETAKVIFQKKAEVVPGDIKNRWIDLFIKYYQVEKYKKAYQILEEVKMVDMNESLFAKLLAIDFQTKEFDEIRWGKIQKFGWEYIEHLLRIQIYLSHQVSRLSTEKQALLPSYNAFNFKLGDHIKSLFDKVWVWLSQDYEKWAPFLCIGMNLPEELSDKIMSQSSCDQRVNPLVFSKIQTSMVDNNLDLNSKNSESPEMDKNMLKCTIEAGKSYFKRAKYE